MMNVSHIIAIWSGRGILQSVWVDLGVKEGLVTNNEKVFVHLWLFSSVCICSTCWCCLCFCQNSLVHPHLLLHSFTEKSCQWAQCRVAALGCNPNQCRQMSTHTTKFLCAKSGFYGMAAVSVGQATVQSLGWPSHMCVYHHIPQRQTKVLTSHLLLRTQTGNQNTTSITDSIIEFCCGRVTHNVSSEPDLDRDKSCSAA